MLIFQKVRKLKMGGFEENGIEGYERETETGAGAGACIGNVYVGCGTDGND